MFYKKRAAPVKRSGLQRRQNLPYTLLCSGGCFCGRSSCGGSLLSNLSSLLCLILHMGITNLADLHFLSINILLIQDLDL